MRIRHPIHTLPILTLLLLSTLALGAKISTDYDHSANFSSYHTYAWTEGTPAKDQLLDQRIRDSVDQQLASRGYRKVDDPVQADVLVAYDATIEPQIQPGTGMGLWGLGWGMGSQLTATHTPSGSLSVRIGDNRMHKIVWRGVASGTFKDKPEKIAQQIQKATAKMFSRYPPKT